MLLWPNQAGRTSQGLAGTWIRKLGCPNPSKQPSLRLRSALRPGRQIGDLSHLPSPCGLGPRSLGHSRECSCPRPSESPVMLWLATAVRCLAGSNTPSTCRCCRSFLDLFRRLLVECARMGWDAGIACSLPREVPRRATELQ